MFKIVILALLVICSLLLVDARDIPRYSSEQVLAIVAEFSPKCSLEVVN